MEDLQKQIEDLKIESVAKSDSIREYRGQIIELNQKVADQKQTISNLKSKLELAEDYFNSFVEKTLEKI